jgi:hypothetical protein
VPAPQAKLPNVAEVLAEVLGRVREEERPLLIALAERMAAERYRGWAGETDGPGRAELLACADREEEIARRVESLFAEAAASQRDILARNPDLVDVNRSLFSGRPLDQQFAIQAQGERLGAATWRSLAQHARDPQARATLLGCAPLEEENAACLESLLRAQP